jgi:hypothetical protein
MTTRYEPPDITATAITWGDEAEHHGGEFVYPGRRVALIPGRVWPNSPEDCPNGAFEMSDPSTPHTEWLAGGTLLVCLGCGLDST